MTSYFEQLFKQMFLEKYSQSDNSENTKERPIKVANEYRKILDKVAIGMIYNSFENEKVIDAMLHLTRSERIIIAFHIIMNMKLAEIAFLLDTSLESTYTHKSTALKKLKTEIESIS